MSASLLHMNAFQLATSTNNMSVGADHLVSTLAARCSLARRLPVKAMSKYVAVLDAIGEVCPLALLARKQLKGEAGNCLVYFNFESQFLCARCKDRTKSLKHYQIT